MAQFPAGCIACPDLSGLAAWSTDSLRGPDDTWPNEAITVLVRACLLPQTGTARLSQLSSEFWRWRYAAGHLAEDDPRD